MTTLAADEWGGRRIASRNSMPDISGMFQSTSTRSGAASASRLQGLAPVRRLRHLEAEVAHHPAQDHAHGT
jgi:hypothetical protein